MYLGCLFVVCCSFFCPLLNPLTSFSILGPRLLLGYCFSLQLFSKLFVIGIFMWGQGKAVTGLWYAARIYS